MPRPQFTLRALLVLMLAVACFFGGMAWQRQLERPIRQFTVGVDSWGQTTYTEVMTTRDGTTWQHSWVEKDEPDSE